MSYGSIYSKSDVRNALLDANKLYKSTYESIDKAAAKQYYDINKYEQTAMDALNSAYNKSLAQQYESSQQAQQSIYGSDLGSNYKAMLAERNKQALKDAYASYRQNYASNLSQLSNDLYNRRNAAVENVEAMRGEVDAALDADVAFAQQYDKAYSDYLTYLWENNQTVFEDERYSKYLTTDEFGNTTVMDRTELTKPGGIMYDPEGNLTEDGKNLIRLLENSNQGKYSFGSYLSGQKEYGDLLNWAMSTSDITGETNRDKILRNIYGIEPNDTVKYDYGKSKYDLDKHIETGFLDKDFDAKFEFTDDNLVKYNSPLLKARSWYVDPEEIKSRNDSYVIDKDYNNKTLDEYLAKYGDSNDVVEFVNDAKKGLVKDGTIFKRTKSGTTQWYIYQNGKIHHLRNVNMSPTRPTSLQTAFDRLYDDTRLYEFIQK